MVEKINENMKQIKSKYNVLNIKLDSRVLSNIEIELKRLNISELSLYEIEDLWEQDELSKINKMAETGELKFCVREMFSVQENLENYNEKIKNSIRVIVSTINSINEAGYFAMDVVQALVMIDSLNIYEKKVEEIYKLLKELLELQKSTKELIDSITQIEKDISNFRDMAFNTIKAELFPEIVILNNMVFSKVSNQKIKALKSLFKLNEINFSAIKDTSLKNTFFYVIIIVGLIIIIIASAFIFYKTNSDLLKINQELEIKVNERTKELREINKKLTSIENLLYFIHKEKDYYKVIKHVISVVVEGLEHKNAYFFHYEKDKNKFFLECFEDKDFSNILIDLNTDSEFNIKLKELKTFCEIELSNKYDFFKNLELKNSVILPVYYLNNLYGLIIIELKSSEYILSCDELEILKIFPNNLAIWFENFRLRDEEIKNEKLTALLKLSKGIVHELRTPLTSIKGLVTMIKKRYATDLKVNEYSDIIYSEISRISDLAEDLVDYGDENYKYNFKSISLYSIINEITSKIKNDFEANNIEFDIDIDENINLDLDLIKIKKAFFHIIKNSIEASKDFSVKIKIVGKIKKDVVELIFEDNGIGISEEKLPYVFEPLFSSKIQGTGLGLTIVKEILRAHNSSIRLESKVNEGTKVITEFRRKFDNV